MRERECEGFGRGEGEKKDDARSGEEELEGTVWYIRDMVCRCGDSLLHTRAMP